MHRTEGDGFIVDPIGGFNVYKDEDPPASDATQLRFQEANTFQEEIVNVILAAGLSLNSAGETVQQMTQLRDAINILIGNEANLRAIADDSLQAQIDFLDTDAIINNSTIIGTYLTDVLEELNDDIEEMDSDKVDNESTVSGASVTIALNNLAASILALASSQIADASSAGGPSVLASLNTIWGVLTTLAASQIANNSSVGGTAVRDALNTLLTGVNANAAAIAGLPSGYTVLTTTGFQFGATSTMDSTTIQENMGLSAVINGYRNGNMAHLHVIIEHDFSVARNFVYMNTSLIISDNAAFFGSYNRGRVVGSGGSKSISGITEQWSLGVVEGGSGSYAHVCKPYRQGYGGSEQFGISGREERICLDLQIALYTV